MEKVIRLRFLFKKGRIELLFYLSIKKSIRHSEILEQNFVRSRSSVSIMLTELEKNKLIKRRVISTKPPQTRYEITEAGQKVVQNLREIEKICRR